MLQEAHLLCEKNELKYKTLSLTRSTRRAQTAAKAHHLVYIQVQISNLFYHDLTLPTLDVYRSFYCQSYGHNHI